MGQGRRTAVWGWDGVIARRELSREAHVKWFDFMKSELGDENLSKYVSERNYFNAVLDITARFADVCKEGNEALLTTIARNFYQSFYLSQSRESERIWPVKDRMMSLSKHTYRHIIVSGTPKEATEAIVNNEGLDKYFCDILASEIHEPPRGKDMLLKEYLEELRKLKLGIDLYVGDGVKDIRVANSFDVKYTVLAAWDKTPDYTGKFNQKDFDEAAKLADIVAENPNEVPFVV